MEMYRKWKCVQKEVNGFRTEKKKRINKKHHRPVWDPSVPKASQPSAQYKNQGNVCLSLMETSMVSDAIVSAWWEQVFLLFVSCSVPRKWRKSSGLRANDVGHVPLHQAKSEVPVKAYAVSLIQAHHFRIALCISNPRTHCTAVSVEQTGASEDGHKDGAQTKTHTEAATEEEMEDMFTQVWLPWESCSSSEKEWQRG